MTVVIEGFANLERILVELGAKAETLIPAALFQEAEHVMSVSRPLVPVEAGILRGSGHVDLPQRSLTGWSVTFGYGGAAQAYAVYQHEHEEFHHPHGGQAHYLSKPVDAVASVLGEHLAAKLRTLL